MATDQDSVVSENENADKNQQQSEIDDESSHDSMGDPCLTTACTHGIIPESHCVGTEKAAVTDDKQLRNTIEPTIQPEFDQKDSANMSTDKGTSGPSSGDNATGSNCWNDIKDNYQEITCSEVSSLDDWEHLHKSCLMEIPPVDPGALHEIEKQAKLVARNLDHMLGTLGSHLNAITKIDSQALATYNTSIDHMNSTVDKSIKGMYTFISKCEELNSVMGPVNQMAMQIKEIKRTLDLFESMCK